MVRLSVEKYFPRSNKINWKAFGIKVLMYAARETFTKTVMLLFFISRSPSPRSLPFFHPISIVLQMKRIMCSAHVKVELTEMSHYKFIPLVFITEHVQCLHLRIFFPLFLHIILASPSPARSLSSFSRLYSYFLSFSVACLLSILYSFRPGRGMGGQGRMQRTIAAARRSVTNRKIHITYGEIEFLLFFFLVTEYKRTQQFGIRFPGGRWGRPPPKRKLV